MSGKNSLKVIKSTVLSAIVWLSITLSAPLDVQAALDHDGPELWSVYYRSSNGAVDVPMDIALDGNNNYYVTGYSFFEGGFDKDIFTLKYDTQGNELWRHVYSIPGGIPGGGGTEGISRAIAVDANGYVYAAGLVNSDLDYNAIILRYTPDGLLDWERRWIGEPYFTDELNDILVSDNSLYVTGDSGGILTMKYDLDGNLVWERKYDASCYGGGQIIRADQSGNIYVGGCNDTVLKYAPNGDLLWAENHYTGIATPDMVVRDIEIDSTGYVYAVGGALAVKYASDGSLIWIKNLIYSEEKTIASHFLLDVSGNFYIAGAYDGEAFPTLKDYSLLKYDAQGNLLWQLKYGFDWDNWICGAEMDAQGFIYILGDLGILKVDPDGNILYRYWYPADQNQLPVGMEMDAEGNTYMTRGSGSDFVSKKYPPQPSVYVKVTNAVVVEGDYESEDRQAVFNVKLSGTVRNPVILNYHTTGATATAGSDYSSVTGALVFDPGKTEASFKVPIIEDQLASESDETFYVDFEFPTNALILTPRVSGMILEDQKNLVRWSVYDSPPANIRYSKPSAIVLDSKGNILVLSDAFDDRDIETSTVIKYSSQGEQLWKVLFLGSGLYEMSLDDQDNAYVVGYLGVPDEGDMVVRKISPDGSLAWERTHSGKGQNVDQAYDVVVAPPDAVYVTGTTATKGVGRDAEYNCVVLKYDFNGNLIWDADFDSILQYDICRNIGLDQEGNVYVSGASNEGEDESHVLLIKFTAAGKMLWNVWHSHGPETSVTDMVVDQSGVAFLAGSNRRFATGGKAGFIFEFSPEGVLSKEWIFGDSFPYSIYDLNMDEMGNLLITGGESTPISRKYLSNGSVINLDIGGMRWSRFFDKKVA